jgi:LysM repeat protein
MNWISIFKIAGGIGSGIAAICFLGALFFQYASRREERTISHVIGTQLEADDVINILREFKDDPAGRLKALEMLMDGQREQAHQLMEKLKSGIDIDKVAQHRDQGTLKLLKPVGVVTLILGLLLWGAGLAEPAFLKPAGGLPGAATNGPMPGLSSNPAGVPTNRPPAVISSNPTMMPSNPPTGSNQTLGRGHELNTSANPPKIATIKEVHTVAMGDTVAKIAKMYNISVTSLESANPTVDLRKIKVGQKLAIPTERGGR